MGHTISNRRRRAEAMRAEVGDFRDWQFAVVCGSCATEKLVEISDITAKHGAQTIGWAVARLRCRLPGCGGRPSRVTLQRGAHGVLLIGPGAFG